MKKYKKQKPFFDKTKNITPNTTPNTDTDTTANTSTRTPRSSENSNSNEKTTPTPRPATKRPRTFRTAKTLTTVKRLCKERNMTFEDCEMAILRLAVKNIEEEQQIQKKAVMGEELKQIFTLLETFIKKKKLVLYGGFAINSILPKYAQFYDEKKDIPDYDFYSPHSMEDAIELADFFHKHGYEEVEAKSGVHYGTYKVYVNYIPIADITFLEKEIFENVQKNAIHLNNLLFCPVNFLRMNLYVELSRPLGDVSRWEKIWKRLSLLNKYYPLTKECSIYSRTAKNTPEPEPKWAKDEIEIERIAQIREIVKKTIIFMGGVFFGGFSMELFSKKPLFFKNVHPEFNVLYEDPEKASTIIVEKLKENGVGHIEIKSYPAHGEIIPAYHQILVNKVVIANIYEPIACHNYNTIQVGEDTVHIATIDTMLSFYFAFLYLNHSQLKKSNILCLAQELIELTQKNRVEGLDGVFQRFAMNCVGKQKTIMDIRSEKIEKYKELKGQFGTKEYNRWFLKYNPSSSEAKSSQRQRQRKSTSTKKEENKTQKIKTQKIKDKVFVLKNYSKTSKTEKKKNKILNPNLNPIENLKHIFDKNKNTKNKTNVFQFV